MNPGSNPSTGSPPAETLAGRAAASAVAAGVGLTSSGVTIRRRLTRIVIAVAVPMLLLSAGLVWQLANRERESGREHIMYASRSILIAVEAQLEKYIAVGEALAASPTLQVQDLAAFREEALRVMNGLPGAWVALADTRGQQVVNTLVMPDATLPPLPPAVAADVTRAFATKQIQVPDLVIGPVAGVPVVGIGVPVFRGDEPAYYLVIATQASFFRDLLDSHRMPEGWLGGIIDRSGNFIARTLDNDRWVGKPASPGWRAVMHSDGVYQHESLEGQRLINANAVSRLSGWAVGIATEESVLEQPIRQTMALAAFAGLATALLSVLLAAWAAQTITSPIKALEKGAEALRQHERLSLSPTGVHEVDDALRAFDSAAKELITRERALAKSEQRMRLAQDAANAGSWEWTLADNRHYWSESLWGLYGLTVAQCEPNWAAWAASIHPDDRGRVTAIVKAAAETKQEFEAQWRVNLPKEEGEHWVLSRGRPVADADGNVERYMGIVIDITERRRAEEALRQSERRMSAILEALPIGVALVDGDGRVVVSNEFFAQYIPKVVPSRDEDRYGLWEGRDAEGHRIERREYPVACALRGERIWPGQEFIFHGDERRGPIWTRIAALPFRDEQGAIIGATTIIVDIDQEKRVQDERRVLQAELLHVSRLSEMGQMAAALAHELNQPLTAVAVYIGGCQRIVGSDQIDEDRRDKLKHLMQMISEQALRAGEIIRQLRDFVGKGEGERRVERATRVMQEASTLAITAAKHKGVLVRTDIDAPGQILVNKVQIQQVVFNLVRNAIEAMESSPRKELDIKLTTKAGHVELSVSDTGAGLAPEIADRLFMPFATTKSQGMGIGLSVCRNIIEAHRGRIWAEPNPGGGTVFRFTLPLYREELVEEAV